MKATAEYGREALMATINNSPSDYGKVKFDLSVDVPCRILLQRMGVQVKEDGTVVQLAIKRSVTGKIDGVRSPWHIYGGKEGGNLLVNFTDGEKGIELGRKIVKLLLGEGKMEGGVSLGAGLVLKALKFYNRRQGHDQRTTRAGRLREILRKDWDVRTFRDLSHVSEIIKDAMER
jgi:hypothetical protein